MQISWGNKLLIVLIVFVSGMAYLVSQCLHTDYELVSADYYRQELNYQQVIDASQRANALSTAAQLSCRNGEVRIQLPEEMKNQAISGEAYFYCPTASGNDKRIALHTNEGAIQVIPSGTLHPANYVVKLSWTVQGIQYYSETPLTVLP